MVHGGLFDEDVSISALNKVNRNHTVPVRGSFLEQALWADPQLKKGRRKSKRNAGLHFGPDVTKRFLAINDLQLIIRSHECKKDVCEFGDVSSCCVCDVRSYVVLLILMMPLFGVVKLGL